MKNTTQLSLEGERLDWEQDPRNIVECEECGSVFEVSDSRYEQSENYFCSNECQAEYQSGIEVEVSCEVCGELFSVLESRADGRKYCSIECVGRSKRNRVELECPECGDLFEVTQRHAPDRVYCSNSCANSQPLDRPASFVLENAHGYPAWTHPRKTTVHQLIAVANGADPEKVYGNYNYSVDHVNGCKLDNRHENIELKPSSEHGRKDRERQTNMGYSHEELLTIVSFFLNPSEYL